VTELRAGDPTWIGPFWLRERLDDGDDAVGIGPAYLGQSPLEELVMIRALRPDLAADKALRARLTRDVAAAREVAGRHVARLAGADLAEYAPWVAWERVPGESLAATVARHGPLPWQAFEALATGLAAGISAIHQAGVVHGNLTPASVFPAGDGAVVTGFGVSAAVAAQRAAGASPGAGSPPPDEFLSPEQAAGGEPTPASDVFSLGAVLAYALCGQGPFSGQPRAGHLIDYAAPALDGIPSFLRPLIARCLQEDPGRRPPSAGLADLVAAAIGPAPAPSGAVPSPVHPAVPGARAAPGTPGPGTRTTPAAARPEKKARGRLRPAGVAILIIAGIVAAVAYAMGHAAPAAPGSEPAGWVPVADVRAGDCILGGGAVPPAQLPDEMWRTPCTGRYDYEVFYVNFRYWPAGERFAGSAAITPAANAMCSARLANDGDSFRRWEISASITPGESGWRKGQRGVVCAAYFGIGYQDGAPAGG
jgi:hypothetical protein